MVEIITDEENLGSMDRKKTEKKSKKKDKKKDSKKDKKKKKSKKRQNRDEAKEESLTEPDVKKSRRSQSLTLPSGISFPIQHILAPMVGASELPFRLLCRKYGTSTCYTPMMSSSKFSSDPCYRKEEFQTIPEDRPLVCHFSANDPEEFAKAALLVENQCDAIDLNLGCPQRTAYLGHFGSYLLDPKDRALICRIVRKACETVSKPVFVKIRLLDTIEDTIELCRNLKDAGASLIAIHARYRASFERKGPGARDGPAMLDQIVEVRKALGPSFPIIANGNVITYDDVVNNMAFTGADGIMSAEGILDNPALFLPRHGNSGDSMIEIAVPSAMPSTELEKQTKLKRKLTKKLREIETIEEKASSQSLTKEQKQKMSTKEATKEALLKLERQDKDANNQRTEPSYTKVPLKDLIKIAGNKTNLASEYLDLASVYPTKMRTIIFHSRRILKQELNEYQLMEECISSKSISDIRVVIHKIMKYQKDPSSFKFDLAKAQHDKEALQKKKLEEGKRKRYEGRMIRKAKREGRSDLEYYLRQGATVPTVEEIKQLKLMSPEEQMTAWKASDHSQHCMAYHLENGGCKRDRACAFLHVDAIGKNTFEETNEVAG